MATENMARTGQTDETDRLISSDKVDGTTVYNRNGDNIGTIDHLMIDKISGQVEYAVMSFGGFLGIGERSDLIHFMRGLDYGNIESQALLVPQNFQMNLGARTHGHEAERNERNAIRDTALDGEENLAAFLLSSYPKHEFEDAPMLGALRSPPDVKFL